MTPHLDCSPSSYPPFVCWCAPLDLQLALIICTSGSCHMPFLTVTIWNITQQDLRGDTVRKQKHPTYKNMWQELSNDTIPKGSAIYPSKDKLPFRPLKPGQFIPIGPTAEIKQYYVQIPKVFFIKYCVMKVRCLLPMERKYFFHPPASKTGEQILLIHRKTSPKWFSAWGC